MPPLPLAMPLLIPMTCLALIVRIRSVSWFIGHLLICMISFSICIGGTSRILKLEKGRAYISERADRKNRDGEEGNEMEGTI